MLYDQHAIPAQEHARYYNMANNIKMEVLLKAPHIVGYSVILSCDIDPSWKRLVNINYMIDGQRWYLYAIDFSPSRLNGEHARFVCTDALRRYSMVSEVMVLYDHPHSPICSFVLIQYNG